MSKKTHIATVEPSAETYQVYHQGQLVLASNQTLKLLEVFEDTPFPAVIYFPPASLAAVPLSKTDLRTYCPIKGEASYWSFQGAVNGIWSYEHPLAAVALIQGYFGFDVSKGFLVQKRS